MDAMGAMGLGIVLSLQDNVSAGLEKIQQQLASFSGASKEMLANFDAGAKEMLGGIASLVGGMKIFQGFNNIFAPSLNTAMDFEQAMARVGAVSGSTGEIFEALTNQAKELGATTLFSASQVASAQESLARAGFQANGPLAENNEIIAAMPGLLSMAAAEGMELGQAADIASSAIRGFGMEASTAGRVADVLAKTSAASNTSIALLGESLKYVAPYAKAVGVDIEQTNAMLGVMANAGIKGTQAGNALKAAFSRLSEEPTRTAQALEELGVKAKTSTGDLRPLPELMKDLAEKTKNMGAGDKVGILNKIFGSVAGGGMLAIMDSVANGSLAELTENIYGASGASKEMADQMNATAKGAMLQLDSASEGLRIAIGNHLLPIFTWATLKFAAFKGWLTKLIEAHPILTKAVIGLTGAITGLLAVTLTYIGAMKTVAGFVKVWPMLRIAALKYFGSMRTDLTSTGKFLATVFKHPLNSVTKGFSMLKGNTTNVAKSIWKAFTGLSTPIKLLIVAAGALYFAWRKNFMGIRDMVSAITNGFKFAVSASKDGIAEVDDAIVEQLQKTGIFDFAVMMGMVFFRIRKFAEGFVEGFMEGINKIKGLAATIADFFNPLIEGGKTLLNMLGLFKPISDTQVDSWTNLGKAIGEVIPYVIALFGAFKALGMAKSIIGGISSALSLITANPIVAVIVAAVALFTYLYTRFEGFRDFVNAIISKIVNIFSGAFEVIKGICNTVIGILTGDWEKFSGGVKSIFGGFVDFIKGVVNLIATPFLWLVNLLSNSWEGLVGGIKFLLNGFVSFVKGLVNLILAPFKWLINLLTGNWGGFIDGAKAVGQGFADWWNSWTLADIFSPLGGLASAAIDGVKAGWNSFTGWFNNISLPNIFANLGDWANSAAEKVKGIWNSFSDWISSLNPFKSWKAPTPEEVEAGKQEIITKQGSLDLTPSYMKAPTPPPVQQNAPTNMLPSYMRAPSTPIPTNTINNTVTERVEKIARTNTITNNNASEKIIERNNTQELQLVPQPPVIQQLMPPSTREVIAQATPEPLWQRQVTASKSLALQTAVTNNTVERVIEQQLIPGPTNTITNNNLVERIEKDAGNIINNTINNEKLIEHTQELIPQVQSNTMNTVTNNNVEKIIEQRMIPGPTITNDRVKEFTNNNTINNASEKIIERNNTQELQLIPQAPVVTQPQVQIVNPETGEAVVKALQNIEIPAPIVEVTEEKDNSLRGMANSYMMSDPRFRNLIPPKPAQPPANSQPATQPLIQHTQNQANVNGNATVQAIRQNKEQLVKVDNDVKVDVKPQNVTLTMDGYQFGQAVARYTTSQTIREGGGD